MYTRGATLASKIDEDQLAGRTVPKEALVQCCRECFCDSTPRNLIEATGSPGTCDYCGRSEVLVVPAETLRDLFDGLITSFERREHSPLQLALPGLHAPLGELVQRELRVFENTPNPANELFLQVTGREVRVLADHQTRLLEDILDAKQRGISLADDWQLRTSSRLPGSLAWHWHMFGSRLRGGRRFLTAYDVDGHELTDLLREMLVITKSYLTEGSVYYRARRGYHIPGSGLPVPQLYIKLDPLTDSEMGAPPFGKTAEGGRLNPPGVPFLYLALDPETAIAESRPSRGERVTVREFKLRRDLRVANLADIPQLDSVFNREDLPWDVGARNFLTSLSFQFGRPVEPQRAWLDYLPTQFATEVIRDAGYEGVVYSSALGDANNLAIFDPKHATGVRSDLYAVTAVRYDATLNDSPMAFR